MPIRLLDPDSAARIAAGEVVERPASVAKELIENAIDAGACHIQVELQDGGLSLLRVIDDGCGIPAEELALAFARHATSKIASIDDLATVATLGFRGEALPSIATVAQVSLASRPAGSASGGHIRLAGGQVISQASAGCPPGTSVTVRELFFNTPARRKFLKTPLAEGGQVTRVVCHYALAYPGIAFSLTADGKRVFQSAGQGDLLDVIARLHGPEVARAMIPVDLQAEAEPGKSLLVRGFVSQPSLSRSSREHLSLFVNGRWIQGRNLLFAVEEAYASLLMVGRHPLAVLHLSLDPTQLDVNVHPAKAEVKFANERAVASRLHQAVHAAVARYAPVPVYQRREIGDGTWDLGGRGLDAHPAPVSELPPAPDSLLLPAPGALPPVSHLQSPVSHFQALPMLRVLGQLAVTYIIAEGPGGLYLIDQHAAHERVRLDELQRARRNDTGQSPDAQLLLQPLTLELSPAQLSVAEAGRPALARLGLDLEPFGERTYLLRSVPGRLPLAEARSSVLAILDELVSEAPADWDEAAAHSLACHTAVRAGQKLSGEEMQALLAQLERCWSPQACAHGRPTMIHLSQAQLEREFGRR